MSDSTSSRHEFFQASLAVAAGQLEVTVKPE
jgi:hypothetical protein